MSDKDHRIRERAYHLWERAGRPHHREHDFWHQAKDEVAAEESRATETTARTVHGASVTEQPAAIGEVSKKKPAKRTSSKSAPAAPAPKAGKAEKAPKAVKPERAEKATTRKPKKA